MLINDIVYAEISIRFEQAHILDEQIDSMGIEIEPMPRAALFLAGKAFKRYRTEETGRSSILPDFFIGAHADVLICPLLTRDPRPYRTYFPAVHLITP